MKNSTHGRGRQYLFWLILALFPFVLLAIAEGLVRLAGLGHSYPLFVPVANQPGYLQPNPDVINRYFSRPDLAPKVSADTLYFLAQKPADSLRIVIMGESTAAGFPYGRFGSPAGMLQQRLKPLYPEKNIEIVNVAMAAINSYTLRDFTDEVLAIKPDVVLIYAGHNEYLGVMGVGSTLAARSRRWQTLTYIALRRSHLFQLFDAAVASLRSGKSATPAKDRTLMAQVAGNKNIALDSPEYRQGLRQFEQNMRDILDKFAGAHVPVIVGRLASNERDQAPFASVERGEPRIAEAISRARQLVSSGDAYGAGQVLQEMLKKHDTSADIYFELGKSMLALGDEERARQAFLRAKDLDLLRFRAPEAINDIIDKFATQSGVKLANVQALLREQSEFHIIGSSMMLEHLHPTSEGYFWLAESFYQALLTEKLLPDSKFRLTSAQALQWRPVSSVDNIFAGWTITRLLSDAPFTSTPQKFELGVLDTPEKQFAAERFQGKSSWLEATQKAFDYYQAQKNWSMALILVGQLSDALPMNLSAAQIAAQIAMDLQLNQLALFYAERGLRIEPQHQELLMLKAHALFLAKRYPESKAMLQRVLSINPQHPQASQFLQEPWATSLE
jgi:tetratricopeptide (TPR) repeat protein